MKLLKHNVLSSILLLFCMATGWISAKAQAAPRQFDIETPSMRVFLPSDELSTGRSIVICPGGGYSHLATSHEGYDWAPFFNNKGIAVIVLRYRMPDGNPSIPVADAEAALKTVRDSADAWRLNPNDIGIMGFSAGGHLASYIATNAETSIRPSFQILFYPVISADLDIRHKGTFVQLMGDKDANSPKAMAFSLEKHVDSTTPPTLLFHSDDDKVVPAVNSAIFYQRLKENGVKASLHIYPSGGHGWGINPKFRYYDDWQKSVLDWLSTL